MNIIKKQIVFLACIINSTFLNADITIKEAWSELLNANNTLKASHAKVKASQMKKESISSMYLPSVSLTGNYTYLDKPIGVDIGGILPIPLPLPELELSEQEFFTANLNVLWPLYTGGKIDAAQDIYKSKVSEAKAMHILEEDKKFLKLIKIYYGVVLSNALYKTRIEAQKSLQAHVKDARALNEQGQIAKIELLSARVKLDAAKIETRAAMYQNSLLKSSLKNLLAQSSQPVSHLFINKIDVSEEHFRQDTLTSYSGLDILKYKHNQLDSLIDIEEAAYMPTVVAYGNYSLYKDESILFQSVPQWFVGVGVKIDIIAREGRSEKVQVKVLQQAQVKFTQMQAKNDLSLLVEKTYQDMLQAYEEYFFLKSSVSLAQENVKLRNIAFKEGLSTSSEVVESQYFLAGSKTKQLNAAYKYVNSVGRLFILSGDRDKFFEFEQLSSSVGESVE